MSVPARRVLGMVLAFGCQTPTQSEAPAAEVVSSIETRWIQPEPASRVAWLDAPARALASPETSFLVSVPMMARVLRVRVRPGERVKQDQPLVDVLLPEMLKAAGTLAAATHRIHAYEARRTRLGPLVEQGLARSTDLSELEANLALARAEWEAARATLRVAGVNEAQVAGLLANNGTISLRSPMPAMVVLVSARPGEVREPASGPLLELVGQGAVQLEARLPVSPPPNAAFSWISGSQNVPLTLDALSPRAAPEDGSRLAWFHAIDPAQAPLPGSLGRVRLATQTDWFVVPAEAVREDGSAPVVVVREGPASREHRVDVVMRSSSEVIVTGLSADMQVAANVAKADSRGLERTQ